MKKWIWTLLAALLLVPAGSLAEGLPGFEKAIEAGAVTPRSTPEVAGPVFREKDGATQEPDGPADEADGGAQAATDAAAQAAAGPADEADGGAQAVTDAAAQAAAAGDLTLTVTPEAERLEEGHSLALSVAALNPLAQDVPVTLTLKLPERLDCAQPARWDALLPAAKTDASGELVPSETVFTREVTLAAGGEDETVRVEAELQMGARFYRADCELQLCVPDVRVSAVTLGAQDGRVKPGESFGYRVDVSNAGWASRDVSLEMILPDGVTARDGLPEGFELSGRTIRGTVRAEAARAGAGGEAVESAASVVVNVTVDEDVLDGDEDATRLLSGSLRADGERVAMPRVQACAARITAQLIPEADSLEVGAAMDLHIAVANTGLMPADVRVLCQLPEGLELAGDGEEEERNTTPEEMSAVAPDDGTGPQAAVLLTEEAEAPAYTLTEENGTLVYDLHMDAAQQTQDGVRASTQILTVRVKAGQAQSGLREKLVGAALSYTAGDETALAPAVAVRVYTPSFLGITRDEWGGIFWAGLLLIVTVLCLYAAVRSGGEDDYCLE